MRDSWANSGNVKYQLVGDNWDKNILPSYRTSERGTLSLHLFNVIAVQNRVPPLLDLHRIEERDAKQIWIYTVCCWAKTIDERISVHICNFHYWAQSSTSKGVQLYLSQAFGLPLQSFLWAKNIPSNFYTFIIYYCQ